MSPGRWLDRLDGAIQRRMPAPLRSATRRALFLPIDFFEAVSGRRGNLPPRGLRGVGAGDFEAVGKELFELLVDHCSLAPDARVLDVGCGVGRLAVPLSGFLSSDGRYHGFDVSRSAVRWCDTNLSARYPNFTFHHVDVNNRRYNWRGAIEPEAFSFPFPDSSFDLVVASSLYTHLLDEAASRYVAETARVLEPGGRCLQTFFLLDAETRDLARRGLGTHRFAHAHPAGAAWLDRLEEPEAAIAYDRSWVIERFTALGLEIEAILDGAWCGRSASNSFQDVVVARKPSVARASR